jgi:hypothetical protein
MDDHSVVPLIALPPSIPSLDPTSPARLRFSPWELSSLLQQGSSKESREARFQRASRVSQMDGKLGALRFALSQEHLARLDQLPISSRHRRNGRATTATSLQRGYHAVQGSETRLGSSLRAVGG